jgi:predicted nucleic acid-binding protein
MAAYFVDSSALVKRYRYEAGSDRVSDLLDRADALVMARLTQVEVSAAIFRRGRAGGMSVQDLDNAMVAFDRDVRHSFSVVEFNPRVVERSIDLVRAHSLRAADAIQLASVLLARAQLAPTELTVLGSDLELNAAAIAEGLSVIDPTQP